jgi:hypothetical protein
MMTLTISLEDETRKTIQILNCELVIESNIDLSSFKLLRYLDAYGDTIFNRIQIDDLLIDLKKLDELATNTIIKQVIELAERCKAQVHSYLCFNGD